MNRSFLYGDGFFETIRLTLGKPEFLGLHLDRARRTAKSLQMNWPEYWDEAFWLQEFEKFSHDTCAVRITFYRGGSGAYLPEENNLQFHLYSRDIKEGSYLFLNTALPINELRHQLNSLLPVRTVIADKIYKDQGLLSSFKTTSALCYVIAALEMKNREAEEIILLNQHGKVCEALSSCLILQLEDKWVTPPLCDGPVQGTYLAFLKEWMPVVERTCTISDIKQAQAVYAVNSVYGFRRLQLVLN
ncbi:MAG: aminotransferase class IV [Flavobacteriales bacterium]|nr:aminotransferase class IV [Bacteroidota bacterium]MCB9241878.1 aminotransferase class IV [Flavobacteriales bacterium]